MPTYYLHSVFAYQKICDLNPIDEAKSAFLLGAVAPDAVPPGEGKRKTHYNFHYGLTWAYRFGKFEKEFRDYQQLSVRHQWFYRGYKYHLRLDQTWMKECLNRAMVRLVLNKLIGRGKRNKAHYYAEMGCYDDFHRASHSVAEQQTICEQLKTADFDLVPVSLDRNRLRAIIGHLEQTITQTSTRYDGQLLRLEDIKRFMGRAANIEAEV